MSRLSLAQQQIVEIAKALSLQSRLVILDEPTSSLPIAETERLLEVIAGLKAHGISVIFISHRLNEVVEASDRVVVLRDGNLVGTLEGDAIDHDTMVRMMVGRELKVDHRPPAMREGGTVISIAGVRTSTYPTHQIDLDLQAGEILGLAGLVGAGRTELARVLFGIDRPHGGQHQTQRPASSVCDIGRRGPCRRLPRAGGPQERRSPARPLHRAEHHAAQPARLRARQYHRSRTPRWSGRSGADANSTSGLPALSQRTGSLSGGNQQKVVLAKWLAMKPKAIIFDEPTRGIDVGAKAEIYDLMREAVGLRRRSSDDLLRPGGGDRRLRPRRGDA